MCTCERAAAEMLVGVAGADGCCSPGVAGSGGSPSRSRSPSFAACQGQVVPQQCICCHTRLQTKTRHDDCSPGDDLLVHKVIAILLQAVHFQGRGRAHLQLRDPHLNSKP